MDYNKLRTIESYYYELAEHVVRVDIVEPFSNELPWKKYSIASLGDIVCMKPLDEKDENYVIKEQLEFIAFKAIEKKNNTFK